MSHTLEMVKSNLRTTENLLLSGSLILKDHLATSKESKKSGWLLDPLYKDGECAIELKAAEGHESGACGDHPHDHMEYIIVKSGSVMLNIEGQNIRVLRTGDCASIKPGIRHLVTPLERSEIVAIYVSTENINL